jgi:hypothetical protein
MRLIEADIETMVDAYIECALWSSTIDGYWDDEANVFVSQEDLPDNEAETHPVDEYFDHLDMDLDTMAAMQKDCEEFVAANEADLATIPPEQAGHDFWLTRCGHGAGFWDRGLGALGDRLSDAARVYGDQHAFILDGKVLFE